MLNGDDDKLSTVKEHEGIAPVFFGMSQGCQVYGDEIVSRGLKGMTCTIHMGEDSFKVDIPMPGRHMVYNALAAAAVGRIYGLTDEQIKAGIESLEPISGRFRMIDTEKFLIVDDCYNANPMSMKASLDVLQDGSGRRVAVLEIWENLAQMKCSFMKASENTRANATLMFSSVPENSAKAWQKKQYRPTRI